MKKIKTEMSLLPIYVLVGDEDNFKEELAIYTGFKLVTSTGKEYYQFKHGNRFYYHI